MHYWSPTGNLISQSSRSCSSGLLLGAEGLQFVWDTQMDPYVQYGFREKKRPCRNCLEITNKCNWIRMLFWNLKIFLQSQWSLMKGGMNTHNTLNVEPWSQTAYFCTNDTACTVSESVSFAIIVVACHKSHLLLLSPAYSMCWILFFPGKVLEKYQLPVISLVSMVTGYCGHGW